MKLRAMVNVFSLVVLGYSVSPLLAPRAAAFDICCSESTECPGEMKCMASGDECSPEAEGRCVPVPDGSAN